MLGNVNLALLLSAIATVESGNNDQAIGRNGEVSRYQILPIVWQAYAKDPKAPVTLNRATVVASRYINTALIPALKRQHKPVTAANIAACWNYGPRAAWHAWPNSVKDYSQRVAALYKKKLDASAH